MLLQDRNDLFFAEPALPHLRLLSTESNSNRGHSEGQHHDYKEQRPHSAIGYLTPARYAANVTATCDRLRNPDQLRRSYVAPHAPQGVKSPEAPVAGG